MEITGREAPQEWWSELPNELKQKVLAWLPAEQLCRYCLVCREWNVLLSSTQFITKDWLAAPPNKKPWLVLFCNFNSLNCVGLCFFTSTWKRPSLAFLLRRQYNVDRCWVHATAAGLFLATIQYFTGSFVVRHFVCNPLTGKSLQLPRIDDGRIWAMTIMAEEGHRHNGDRYKVIAIVKAVEERVEMYDSSLNSWSTAGILPQNITTFTPLLSKTIVVSEDFLYWKCLAINSLTRGILAFSIQNRTSVFTPLPVEDNRNRCNVLFACGSRVLLGSCICDLGVIIISELENPHSQTVRVTEIARMPPHILDPQKRDAISRYGSLSRFDFEGTRDLVCIRYGSGFGNEVLVYNLSENTWTWLSECPVPDGWHVTPCSFVFQPRPDMEV